MIVGRNDNIVTVDDRVRPNMTTCLTPTCNQSTLLKQIYEADGMRFLQCQDVCKNVYIVAERRVVNLKRS